MLRKTLDPHFWTTEFTATDGDLDFLYEQLATGQLGTPAPFEKLAISLIEHYQARENSQIEKMLKLGTMYQPGKKFAQDQTLVFTAMDYRTGTVMDIRDGYNPEHGRFSVLEVLMSDPEEICEFAAQLKTKHPLNDLGEEDFSAAGMLTSEEIFEQHEEEIEDALRYALEEGPRSGEFIEWNGDWLLRDQLVEVDEFSLNMAEAKIYDEERPVLSSEILGILDLKANELSPELLQLSLDIGLSQDPRFEEVMAGGVACWHRASGLPAAARSVPEALQPVRVNYVYSTFTNDLLSLEANLADEWSERQPQLDTLGQVHFVLLYPHRLHGTLPVTGPMEELLDLDPDFKTRIEMRDPVHGGTMECWYVPEGRYICGLEEFYLNHNISAGANLYVERRSDGTITLNFNTRRPKQEWFWTLNAVEDPLLDGAPGETVPLRLEIDRAKSIVTIGCELDTHQAVACTDEEKLAEYRTLFRNRESGNSIFNLVEEVAMELLKKPDSTVHASTVYSVVNAIQRYAPGLVIHALTSNSRLRSLSDPREFGLTN